MTGVGPVSRWLPVQPNGLPDRGQYLAAKAKRDERRQRWMAALHDDHDSADLIRDPGVTAVTSLSYGHPGHSALRGNGADCGLVPAGDPVLEAWRLGAEGVPAEQGVSLRQVQAHRSW